MRKIILVLMFLLTPVYALADQISFTIPGHNWQISFDAPPLSDIKESSRDYDYALRASSDRFTLSFFVETPRNDERTHKGVYSYYWQRGSRNPMMDKKSIVVSEAKKYIRVQYDLLYEWEGKKQIHRNVNYYFCYRDKWVNVHISIGRPTSEDNRIFKTFDDTLNYSPVASGNAEDLIMSRDDTFRVEETEDWKVEVIRNITFRYADVYVRSKRGYEFSMMLYFKRDTKELSQFDTPEKIADSVRKSSEKYLSASVEKKVSLQNVPVKGTYGFYTIFTDAEVARKATRTPGEFKHLTRGMVRLSKDSALGFSVMTHDIDSEAYRKLLDYVYHFVK